jgi:hypothetical protein
MYAIACYVMVLIQALVRKLNRHAIFEFNFEYFLAADPEVPGSIPGAARFSE